MSWGKKRQPARQPHPNPGIELELQRILDLRASIDRRGDLVRQYRDEIRRMHSQSREESNSKRIDQYLAEAKVLHERILETEASIPATHEEIAMLASKRSDSDLAFL